MEPHELVAWEASLKAGDYNAADVRGLIEEIVQLQKWKPAIEQAQEGMRSWMREAHEAACREAAWRALAVQLVMALQEHRVDMHQTSSRPCATCCLSARALARAQELLGPEYPKHQMGGVRA